MLENFNKKSKKLFRPWDIFTYLLPLYNIYTGVFIMPVYSTEALNKGNF